MAKKKKRFLERMQSKFLLVVAAFLLLLLILIIRLAWIDKKDGARYEKIVLAQQSYDSIEIPYRRGDILDRNGTQLATSEKVYNLIIEPKNILQSEEVEEATISALTKYFDVSKDDITKALKNDTSLYKKLLKKLPYEQVEPFNKFIASKEGKNVKGVWFEEEYQRYYPYDSLACHAIGFTVSGNVGQGGIEGYYTEELNGVNGREYGYLTEDMSIERTTKEPINGYNVVSTIDANIQKTVEDVIAQFMTETGARNVSCLVMDPNSGEILSMANSNTYNLNKPYEDETIASMFTSKNINYLLSDSTVRDYFYVKKGETLSEEKQTLKAVLESPDLSPEDKMKSLPEDFRLLCLNRQWRNFILSDGFEPGSTYKTYTISGAVEESVLNGTETFYCEGVKQVEDYPIHCHNHEGHGTVTIEQALMQSCNVALMDIASAEGRSVFSKYQESFGFGKPTGIDLPGEASGLVYEESGLNPVELATSSFGQGLTVTMIQNGAAFSSVVNGGNYYEPHMVKQIVNENGGVIKNIEPTVLRKTISEETSEFMRDTLFKVVDSGTGQKVKVEGYTIGGKTGTAEKLPRNNGKYLLSFIGFAPVENPQVVVYVAVDEPDVEDQSATGYGTILAHAIFEKILPYMNVYQTEDALTEGDPNIGDESITPVFEGEAPQEQLSSEEGFTEGTTETTTEGTSEAPVEGTTETSEQSPPVEGDVAPTTQ